MNELMTPGISAFDVSLADHIEVLAQSSSNDRNDICIQLHDCHTYRMLIHIDAELCIGTGNCVFNAPGVFDQTDDGTAFVVDVDAQTVDKILFAAASCPVRAITVEQP
jgi:ferredoxin